MEAQNSITIKDYLIDVIKENSPYSKEIIEQVVAFQGEDILRAIKEHSQVEISGFGLLYVAKGKIQKRIDRFTAYLAGDKPRTPEHEEDVKQLLEFLKEKQCQNLQNI